MIADLIHGGGIVQATVQHRIKNIFGLIDIGQRISVDHNQIGQFAGLQGTDMFIQPDIFSPVDGCHLECVVIAHPTLRKHPRFPMCRQSLELSMRSHVYGYPTIV